MNYLKQSTNQYEGFIGRFQDLFPPTLLPNRMTAITMPKMQSRTLVWTLPPVRSAAQNVASYVKFAAFFSKLC